MDPPAGDGKVPGDEIFLADEGRWENMDSGEEKKEDQEKESREAEQEVEHNDEKEEEDGQAGNWQKAQRHGNRFKCPTCGITRNIYHQITRHMREHEEDIDEYIHTINTCDKCSNQSKTDNQTEKNTR